MYYQNEPRFNGVYSRDNLPNKIKDGAYIINLDEYSDTEALGFGVECILKEIKKIINNKNIIGNIFRLQAYDSVMCGYFVLDLLILCLKTIT